jgi:hypothetical protein
MLLDFELFLSQKKKISIIESFEGSWNICFFFNENPNKKRTPINNFLG